MTFQGSSLRDVDLILAEDTRHTKVTQPFEIETPQKSFHEHNTQENPNSHRVAARRKNHCASEWCLVPSISDPGLNSRTSLCLVGIPLSSSECRNYGSYRKRPRSSTILFLWVLTTKEERKNRSSEQHAMHSETVLFYMSLPFRLKDTFSAIQNRLRRTTICCVMPRVDENMKSLSAEQPRRTSSCPVNEEELKGECCILLP